MFIHDALSFDDLEAITTPAGRVYRTPAGDVPSVTTLIGKASDKTFLERWRKRVGDEAADGIVRQSQNRGTAFHQTVEDYLNNKPDWWKGIMPNIRRDFETIRPILDTKIGLIRAIEAPLWSTVLKTAGRVDLIAEYDGTLSIIDFKTSRRRKTEAQILNYFVQKSCYGLMFFERTGIEVNQIVTLMVVDHDTPMIAVKRRRDYDLEVKRIFIDERPA
jgi:hypothetical protein